MKGKQELEMTAIAGALSLIGDIDKPPLCDALDSIRIRGERIAELEGENERLERNVLRKHKALEIASGILAEHDGYEWARGEVASALAPEGGEV